jgi:glycosyltransferase involved in cell wall biosynthesis
LIEDVLKKRLMAGVISRSPLVLFTGWHLFDEPITDHLRQLGIRGVTLLMTNWWSVEDMQRYHVQSLGDHVGRMLSDAAAGGHNLMFLCNTPAERQILERLGARARLAPANCLVDERTFRPGAHPPSFDAIYNAQMAPFKRHELAVDVDSLLLVYGVFGDQQRQRFRDVWRLLPHAAMANGDPDAPQGSPNAYRRLKPAEVAAHYTMARTGLCLSETEGNMHAAIEYLMAGLPVVSTPSLGGRDMFFRPDQALVVPARPEEIARAVGQFCRRPHDPLAIRASTMAIVKSFRADFAAVLADMLSEAGVRWFHRSPEQIVDSMCHDHWHGQDESTVGAVFGAPGYAALPSLIDRAM